MNRPALSRPRAPIHAPPPPRRVELPPLKAPPAKAATLRTEAPLYAAGQGRAVEDARMSAEALILCVLGAGFIGLVVLLGHVARWFA